jgi:hypothetical protein
MKTKTTPTLDTIERLFDEVDEWYGRVHRIRHRLGRLKRGSEPYLDLCPICGPKLMCWAEKRSTRRRCSTSSKNLSPISKLAIAKSLLQTRLLGVQPDPAAWVKHV